MMDTNVALVKKEIHHHILQRERTLERDLTLSERR